MTTQELKDYTNRILGSSIRCLLPSYWWKRLFGLVVDKVEEVDTKIANLPTKEYVDNAVDNIEIEVDAEISSTSVNPVQNKVVKEYIDDKIANIDIPESGITAETDPIFSASPAAGIKTTDITNWNNKVDKVSGKQLSTEDFTTALKTKLEGLSNYDDTALETAISTLRSDFDKLVSGDTTTAIKTFNEVIAFLNGISDTESLDSIIASIEQQIAANTQQISAKQDALVSGTNIKTINGESILGEGNIETGVDTSTLATKEEVIDNEQVIALAFSKVRDIILTERIYNNTIYYSKKDIDKKIEDLIAEIIKNEEVVALAYSELKVLNTEVQMQCKYLQSQIDSLKNAQ